MQILICLSIFSVASAYATYVTYPYVYRTPVVQNGFYHGGSYGFSALGAPSVAVIKPFYPGFYDYRLGLSPFYQPGLYPSFATAPTIIHLIPAEDEKGDKKKNKKKSKGKDGKEGKEEKDDDESTTMSSEDKEELEKAEEEDDSGKSDSVEVENV